MEINKNNIRIPIPPKTLIKNDLLEPLIERSNSFIAVKVFNKFRIYATVNGNNIVAEIIPIKYNTADTNNTLIKNSSKNLFFFNIFTLFI